MKKPKFSLVRAHEMLKPLAAETDKRTLAMWARDCAARVLPYFEAAHPEDRRPRQALEALQAWIDSGKFSMKTIRAASLGAHAAARDVGEDSAPRSAARSAGQAVATTHVWAHAIGGATYAQQAVHRAASDMEAEAAVAVERDWQVQHLLNLRSAGPT